MSKRSSLVAARRAWKILRLALLRARKGGVFRNYLEINLNILIKGIRKLRHTNESRRALAYGDHEFSFDETPMIHVKMHRPSSLRFKMPHIPCITPQVDFDYDFEVDDVKSHVNDDGDDEMLYGVDHVQRTSFFEIEEDDEEEEEEEEISGICDEGIDLKADKFIANFYEQMKQQRQISYLQYNQTLY